MGNSVDEFGVLEDERCINKGASQIRYLLHEFMFAMTQGEE